MPGFDGARDFPTPADDLAQVPSAQPGRLRFAALAPAAPFDEFFALGAGAARPAARVMTAWWRTRQLSRDYEFDLRTGRSTSRTTLEGLHIPFIHRACADARG